MPKLTFEHNIYGEHGELTRVEFTRNDDIPCDEFLSYFIRFALAAGYQLSNIEDSIIQLAHEYENSELVGKYDRTDLQDS
jgi:hypothetical protein